MSKCWPNISRSLAFWKMAATSRTNCKTLIHKLISLRAHAGVFSLFLCLCVCVCVWER
jgi:hypothetical protein